MSNSVGKLYEYIIDGVIREAQADFEDLGVPLSTLQQLKAEWQKRLSSMHVTSYLPWDMGDRWSGVSGAAPVYYGGYDLGMPVLGGNPAVPPPPSQTVPQQPMLKQEDYQQYPPPPPPQQDPSGLVLPQVPQTDGAPVVIDQKDLFAMIGEKMAEKLSQADGNGEEVGSDLDDSEDDLNSDEEEGDNGMVMLCLYEKVQRVKNKWKFIFKDGVATINGADYVFSRGTGEAEW